MTDPEYRAIQRVSNSALSHLLKSPMKYQYFVLNGMEDTDSLRFGRLYHMAILEGKEAIAAKYKVFDPEDRPNKAISKTSGKPYGMTAKENKAWKADLEAKAAASGMELITTDDRDKVIEMYKALYRVPDALEIMRAEGECEKVVLWTDEETGIECKAKLDKEMPSMVPDLKTTRDASEAEFIRSAYKYGYYRQAAFYLDGSGKKKCRIIAQETIPPYDVNVFHPSEDFIWLGRTEYKGLLNQIKILRDKYGSEFDPANKWPGYSWKGPSELGLPPWVKID